MNSRANSKKRRTWGIIIPAEVEFFVRVSARSVAEAKKVAIRALDNRIENQEKNDDEIIVIDTGRPRLDTDFGVNGMARR